MPNGGAPGKVNLDRRQGSGEIQYSQAKAVDRLQDLIR
jgi:hypothetical protein